MSHPTSEWMETRPMQAHNSPWTDAFQAEMPYEDASAEEDQSAEQQPTHDALALVYNRDTSD